ncbi:hypothetical protein Q3H58_001962 [Pseudomonas psychrotolerans]|nr:hypothetical protein [Pseudomonas psychrotolerans]
MSSLIVLQEFCVLCEVSEPVVVEIVEHGILAPQRGKRPAEWHFDTGALYRAPPRRPPAPGAGIGLGRHSPGLAPLGRGGRATPREPAAAPEVGAVCR